MKTIRLLYPDHLSGGLPEYYLGAALLTQIVPENPDQPLLKVRLAPPSPNDAQLPVTDGVYALEPIVQNLQDAKAQIKAAAHERIITLPALSNKIFEYSTAP